jgi:calpain
MTGMVADKTKLEGIILEDQKAKDDLWEELKKSKRNGTMMGCSAEGETEGYIEIEGESSGKIFFV